MGEAAEQTGLPLGMPVTAGLRDVSVHVQADIVTVRKGLSSVAYTTKESQSAMSRRYSADAFDLYLKGNLRRCSDRDKGALGRIPRGSYSKSLVSAVVVAVLS